MSIESVIPSNHLILYHPLLLPPSIFPSIRVFSSESVLCIRWPKYWRFSFRISPSNEYSGVISSSYLTLWNTKNEWFLHIYSLYLNYLLGGLVTKSCCLVFATPWTVVHQAPLSIGFFRQECWSGLPFLSPGDLPNPGIETGSPGLQEDSLATELPGKPLRIIYEERHSWGLTGCICCCCSLTKWCPTLCDPVNCSTPGFPVLHCLLEFAQTHVHWVGDAMQSSLYPLKRMCWGPNLQDTRTWLHLETRPLQR